MYLVDTSIVATVARGRNEPSLSALRDWMDAASNELFISALSIAEIEKAIGQARHENAVKKAGRLMLWLDIILHLYSDRILSFDTQTARIAARLLNEATSDGQPTEFKEAALAATALRWNLTLLTRNARHFRLTDVVAIDPTDHLNTFPNLRS